MSTPLPVTTPLGPVQGAPYPGRIIKVGEQDKATVLAVQQRLNTVGCGPIAESGTFDPQNTKAAVMLFQARFTDADGLPLQVDGEIGPLTWGAMFGFQTVAHANPTQTPLLATALRIAATQIGVLERPLGSNRGPEVDAYLQSVGVNPAQGSFPWCAAFVYFCYQKAANDLTLSNPLIKTAGVLDHWNRAGVKPGVKRIVQAQAMENPNLINPGMIFVMDFGGGAGHTGFVEQIVNGKLVTIEGNTNDGGSREGIGVFRRQGRKLSNINKGFIDYSGA